MAEVELQEKLYEPIKASMKILNKNTALIRDACDREPRTANEKDRQLLARDVTAWVSECNANAMDAKKRLDAIDSDNRAFARSNPDEAAALSIRTNLHSKMLVDFKKVMSDFHSASGDFTKALQDTTRRQLQHVGVKESDVELVIASGKASEVVKQAMVGSDQLDEVIDEIEQRHDAVLKLERSVREVQQLFVDLATLVDIQQDSLDVVGNNLSEAKQHVTRAEATVKETEVYQAKSKKRTCLILIVIMVVLLIILIPTLATTVGKS